MMKKSNPYRYVICACSTGLMFMNMGLLSTALSVYFPYIQSELHFSNTQLYLLPTIRIISTIFFTLFTDTYYRRLGIKKGCLGALLCTSFGFFLLSAANSFLLYEACMVLFGFSYAMGAMIPASLVVRQWFPDRFASAMGVVTAGTGISSIILPIYIRHVVPAFGLARTLLIEAATTLALGMLIMVLIRECRQETECVEEVKTELTASEVTCRLNRWQVVRLYTSAFALGWLALTAVSGLSMLFSTTGHSADMASRLISAFGVALIAGKVAFGVLCDRIGSSRTTGVYCLLITTGIIMCCWAQDAPYGLLLTTTCIFAAGCSLASVGITVIARDISTGESYGKTLKNLQFAYSTGGIVSGTIPGVIADGTGSYLPAYWLFAGVAIVLSIALTSVYKGQTMLINATKP